MSQHADPFAIVKGWWGNKPLEVDTLRVDIDLNSEEGAFECFILAILYAIEDRGQLAENAFGALRAQGLTNINLLSSTVEGSPTWDKFVATLQRHYEGRLKARKTEYIVGGAKSIVQDTQLRGDLRNLYSACGGNECQMLRRLWKFRGLKKKAFWIMREMRTQKVWDIDGKYCCVPDKQVGSSLERWNKISGWVDNQHKLSFLLNCSDIVWQAFKELYDLPILRYAQEHKCNDDRSRKCRQCDIATCNARPMHATLLTTQTDHMEEAMGAHNNEMLTVNLPAQTKKVLGKVAQEQFGLDAATLAQVWIIDKLQQLSSPEDWSPGRTPSPQARHDPRIAPSVRKRGGLTNVLKMKQVIEQQFGYRQFAKQQLLCAMHHAYPEVPDNQILPHDWSVNTDSGKRRQNAYLIRVGYGGYRMFDPSHDRYRFTNGEWRNI